MWADPVVEETRRLREEYAGQFGHDMGAILKDLRERQRKTTKKVVSLPRRPPVALKTVT